MSDAAESREHVPAGAGGVSDEHRRDTSDMSGEETRHDPAVLPTKPDIGFEEFIALDMRVGRVTAVEAFPEARVPAWKLTVDLGPVLGHRRTSAQVTNYTVEELEGRLVVAAVNLGRKRIAGFVSELLVLGALAADGTVALLEAPDGTAPGSAIA